MTLALHSYPIGDTIVAAACASGVGSRRIVRLSGPQALAVAARVVTSPAWTEVPTRLRRIWWPGAFCLAMQGVDGPVEFGCRLLVSPDHRSFTGEPAVEIHAAVPAPVLSLLIRQLVQSGARLARPGEFTLRVFLAGRMDLTQAEALLAAIHARSESEFEIALRQMAGGLAGPFAQIRESLLILLADLEAGLDFVEEDIEFIDRRELERALDSAALQLQAVANQIQGRGAESGVWRVALIGPPNAGKSSLFNALTGQQNAIVSPEAGTTRDYVGKIVEWSGRSIEFVDTAGLETLAQTSGQDGSDSSCDSSDHNQGAEGATTSNQALSPVLASPRQLAQTMTAAAMAEAHLWLVCRPLDELLAGVGGALANQSGVGSGEPTRGGDSDDPADWGKGNEGTGLEATSTPLLRVATKSDLGALGQSPEGWIAVSALFGKGLQQLQDRIIEKITLLEQNGREVVPTTLLRCQSALTRALDELRMASDALRTGAGDEVVSAGLRMVLDAIGEITGSVCTDDVLDRIFSRFCIGK